MYRHSRPILEQVRNRGELDLIELVAEHPFAAAAEQQHLIVSSYRR